MSFRDHITKTVRLAEWRTSQLGRLVPNIGGPSSSSNKRRLFYGAIQSTVLYGGQVWRPATRKKTNLNVLERLHKRALLRMMSAFRPSTLAALQIATGIMPIEILAFGRKHVFKNGHKSRSNVFDIVEEMWQEKWEEHNNIAHSGLKS